MQFEHQFKRLEGKIRRLQAALALALILPPCAIVLMALAEPIAEEVKAKKFVLVSDTGIECASLERRQDGSVALVLQENEGHPKASILFSSQSGPLLQLLGPNDLPQFQLPLPQSHGAGSHASAGIKPFHPSVLTEDSTVYKIPSGSKFHLDDCPQLAFSRFPLTLKEARTAELEPCATCDPLRADF